MSVLAAYRHHRHWTEEDVAIHLGISVHEYKELEAGVDRPDGQMAAKLSDLFMAPPHLFLPSGSAPYHTTIFSNCSFRSRSASGYINNLYHDEAGDKEATIKVLKDQISVLKAQNETLMEIIKQNIG